MTQDPAKNPYTANAADGGSGFAAGGTTTINGFATTGMIISLGLVGGVVAVSAVMTFLMLSDPPEDQPVFRFAGESTIFVIVGYAVFIGGAAAAVVLRRVMKQQAVAEFKSSNAELPQPLQPHSPLPGSAVKLLGAAQVYTIVGGALLEGPAVLNAILMFIDHNFAHAIPVFLAVIGILIQVPTAGRYQQLLEDARLARRL